jgi:peptidoglycan/xylan/chitin deacetylase (PgdA/CDA1 family)
VDLRGWITGWTKRALLAAGHYRRRLAATRFPGVAVLCYHGLRQDEAPAGSLPFEDLHVRASELAAHCRLVRETCHPISLEQWRAALAGGPPLPERPVLFTFDDGYRSFLAAAEILDRHQVPAVLFACSSPLERRVAFWFDTVARLRGEAEVERLKTAPYRLWREETARLERAVGAEDPAATLSPAELRGVAARASCEVGGHTAAHPVLSRAEREDQRTEIGANRRQLEEWTGRRVTAFAYPNGRPGLDYTPETVELARLAGYEFGFTTRPGFATADEPPLERSRFTMLAGISGEELAHRLCYSWSPNASAS